MRATASLLVPFAACAVLLSATAFAKDKPKPDTQAEVRVVVLDPKGVPVGGDAATVTLDLDYGGFQKSHTAEAVKAAVPAKVVAGSHDGQTSTFDGWSVEVVVVPRKGPKAPAPEGPYFKATVTVVGYQDSMKCVLAEKPGPCPRCGMGMGEVPAPFKAVVVVKAGDKSVEATGFTWPETVGDAAERIEAFLDEIDVVVAGEELAQVRGLGEKLVQVARRLDDDAEPLSKTYQAAVKKARDEIVALVEALGKAADAGKADEAKEVAAKLRTKVEPLKKFAK